MNSNRSGDILGLIRKFPDGAGKAVIRRHWSAVDWGHLQMDLEGLVRAGKVIPVTQDRWRAVPKQVIRQRARQEGRREFENGRRTNRVIKH